MRVRAAASMAPRFADAELFACQRERFTIDPRREASESARCRAAYASRSREADRIFACMPAALGGSVRRSLLVSSEIVPTWQSGCRAFRTSSTKRTLNNWIFSFRDFSDILRQHLKTARHYLEMRQRMQESGSTFKAWERVG